MKEKKGGGRGREAESKKEQSESQKGNKKKRKKKGRKGGRGALIYTTCQFSWYKHSMRANFTYQYDFMNKNWQEMYTDQFSEADKCHLRDNSGLSVKSFTHLPP